MEFRDKMLHCVDCGSQFVFTAGEQEFFHARQFRNEPRHCRACKGKRVPGIRPAPEYRNGQYRNTPRVETRAICSQCGKETTVPFQPRLGRPVFCRECFQDRRAATA